jgi:hypothetical protein
VGTRRVGAQHTLRHERDQWFTPRAQHLAAQQVKILRGRRRLANLHIVVRRQLEESLHARARVLGPVAFVSVRQEQHQPRQQAPLVLAGTHELVDDDLRAVGEIAELRLPQHERVGKLAAVPVFETHRGRFGERAVDRDELPLAVGDVRERNVSLAGAHVDERGVAVVEGSAP